MNYSEMKDLLQILRSTNNDEDLSLKFDLADDEDFVEMVEAKKQEELKSTSDRDSYEEILHYFSNNKPNYLIVSEQEKKVTRVVFEEEQYSKEKELKKQNRKTKKFLIAIATLIAVSYIIFTSSFSKDKKETRQNNSIKYEDSVKSIISGEELYNTFIQYAKDNDIMLNAENYREFAEWYTKYLEDGGEKYYSLGGKNNER